VVFQDDQVIVPSLGRGYAAETDAEPARRIIEAARRMVGERGIERSHVGDIAAAAGLSRGLVRYYFGSKDGLMLQVMEADARDRLRLLEEHLQPATSVDEFLDGLATTFGEFVDADRGAHLLLQELGTLAMRRSAIRARRAQLRGEYRRALAEILAAKQRDGVIALRDDDPDGVAALLIALAQGMASEVLADPEWESGPALAHAMAAARHMLVR
jgi:AcrR family transcriptional regulator